MNARRLSVRALPFIVAAGLIWSQKSTAHADGPALFTKGLCISCHSLGTKRLVGPGLEGVTKRRSQAWLEAFIKDSQAMVKKGDPIAVKLFNEYNKVPMPPPPLTAAEIKELIAFLGGPGAKAAGPTGPTGPVRKATAKDLKLGRNLFQGIVRFKNEGPACNSCHNVRKSNVFSGGILAKDLTQITEKLTPVGVGAMIANPPSTKRHKLMQQAYKNHKLTEGEVFALVAFLVDVNRTQARHKLEDYATRLLAAGGGGFVALMVLFGLIWMRRKKRSVNQDIYDRQIRSS